MSLPKVILVITIDVEEDNWSISRSNLTVENVREINRLQVLFDRYGVKPTYLLSYQVTSCDWAVNILAKILAEGKCEIGAHLHPWNTPPLKDGGIFQSPHPRIMGFLDLLLGNRFGWRRFFHL